MVYHGRKRKIRLSCGVVIARNTPEGRRLLLLRAFRNWDFPKGMMERDETPFGAAVREVQEETTLDDLDFKWGEEFIETGPYSRGKVARYYIALTRREDVSLPVNPEIGRPEHAEYRWVDIAEAMSMTTVRLSPVIEWATQQFEQDIS
ncbi:MAG: NUDIX domain-containing protein [Gammaproteobacteria bacterium]|nr:NUDIX domain-containing protein [Gammaproteobacteria bacterium]